MMKGPFMFGTCVSICILFGCIITFSAAPWERLACLIPFSIGITGAYTSIIFILADKEKQIELWEL